MIGSAPLRFATNNFTEATSLRPKLRLAEVSRLAGRHVDDLESNDLTLALDLQTNLVARGRERSGAAASAAFAAAPLKPCLHLHLHLLLLLLGGVDLRTCR